MRTLDRAMGTVQQLDHFVIPAVDLDRAEYFYCDVLGARTVIRKDDEGASFMKLGLNHFALFTQSKATMPVRRVLDSYPRCSYAFSPEGFDRRAQKIKDSSSLVKVIHDNAVANTCGFSDGLVFMDSEGNLMEIFKGEKESPTRLHHLHFDTTNLAESIAFYTNILSLELLESSDRTAVLGVPTNQRLILHQSHELCEVSRMAFRGRHFAFHVSDANFYAIVSKLKQAGVPEQPDHHAEREGRKDDELAVYFLDPSGFRMQIVNHDSMHFARKYNFTIETPEESLRSGR